LVSEVHSLAVSQAFYEKNAHAILRRLVPLLRKNDIVVVFSNRGFDGIHGKLLAQLAA
jgi:UDP-N-acetylmuramate: L-alanyl-gamma-D-glutamyl-meso-diaminopimelate ligase